MVDNTSAFHSSEYDKKNQTDIPLLRGLLRAGGRTGRDRTRRARLLAGCRLRNRNDGIGCLRKHTAGKICFQHGFVGRDDRQNEGTLPLSKRRVLSVRDVRDLQYENEFDVITAIQVFHFLQAEEEELSLGNAVQPLKRKRDTRQF